MSNSVRGKIAGMKDWLVEIRRTIHMNPELMFEEVKTAALAAEWLEKFGYKVQKGMAKTGVVGLLEGERGGKTIALRADMDALPMEEINAIPYASKVKGKMHACGHDAHVTILLGAARFFSTLEGRVKGNIKFLFQPAEEGGAGAKIMMDEGVLENPKVEAIFGVHVFPDLPTGKVGLYEREGLAATDRFEIRITGKGGHGAYPHLTKDPILAAAHLITQIHSIVSRNIDPLDSGVISVCRVSGGTAFNIIPDEVELVGTIRSLTPAVQKELKTRLEQVSQGVAQSFRVECKFNFQTYSPALINDPAMSRFVAEVASQVIGKENVETMKPVMGGEDFAFFLEKVPGAYFRLGCGNKDKGITQALHNSRFNLDEDVLPLGVEMFVRIVDQYLGLKLP